MEWLLLPALGITIWLLSRSLQQEQQLDALKRRLQQAEETSVHQAARASGEAERLRSQVLELLRAHSQLQRRISDLQEAFNAEPARPPPAATEAVPPSPAAAPPPVVASPENAPAVAPVPETAHDLANAAFAAATVAGLADPTAHAEPAPWTPNRVAEETAQLAPTTEPLSAAESDTVETLPPAYSAPPSQPVALNASPPPPVTPPLPSAAPPMSPAPASFDWEQLLGVRGAAWLGGIALAVAGTLFAKYSIENGLISPTLRVILMILAALGALVGSEFFLRPRYDVTANAACGAGVAVLYTAFFSAHALYDLLPMAPTFGLMLLATVTAALLSLRYNSIYIAVLGLIGGFATPVALSTGQDRPVGLFAYVLLLNFGFLWVAVQRRWHRLLSLSLAGTLLIQTGWAVTHLSPQKLPVLVVTSAVFALLYISVPLFMKRFDAEKHQALLWNATVAALWPFVFSLVLATQPSYAERWPLLFALVLCVDLGLFILAVERWSPLLWPALLGTCLTQLVWASTAWQPHHLPVLAGTSLLFALLFGLLPLAYRLRHKGQPVPETAQLTASFAALWPLVASLMVTASDFGGRHLLLYGWVVVAYLWTLLGGLREGRALRLIGAAAITALGAIQWLQLQLTPELLWPAALLLLIPVVVANLAPRLAPLLERADVQATPAQTRTILHELAASVSLLGLLGIAALVIGKGLAEPPWVLLVLLLAVFVLLGERSRPQALPLVQPVLTLIMAMMLWAWLLGVLGPDGDLLRVKSAARVLRDLAVPLLLAAAMQLRAAIRAQRGPVQVPKIEQLGLGSPGEMIWDSELSASLATFIGMIGAVLAMNESGLSQRPGLALLVLLGYNLLVLTTVMRQTVTLLVLCAELLSAAALGFWQRDHYQAVDFGTVMPLYGAFYLWFLLWPLGFLLAVPRLRARRSLFFAAGLAGPVFFYPLYKAWLSGLGDAVIGALPVVMATLSVAALAIIQALPSPGATPALSPEQLAERHLGHRALFAAVGIGFIALAIPLQLQKQWIAVAWALEAASVWWLFRKLPHPGLKYFGLALYCGVLLRLIPDANFLTYHERGMPVFNWLLYSYGVPCLCFLIGAAGLRPVEAKYRRRFEDFIPVLGTRVPLAGVIYYAGLVLVFVLINLEIADAFSVGRYTELWQERSYARDLTRSVSWVLYAITLLITGMRQSGRGQRFFSLGLMLLTVGKVFLYDLAKVGGIYRALSFLGLAVSLFVVSLLYQRLAFRTAKDPSKPAPPLEKQP
ncbi:MAG: DUF2339 domain-containing protein [Myxococcales bacterium]|nr:DUF2339 domain-containing protein [Myxococcales bacterium]